MSQENVEVVRASFGAWNAGEMDAWSDFLAPDVTWGHPEGWPEPGPTAGREAVLRLVQQLREAWDADAAEPISDFIHAADRIVVRLVWRGQDSGLNRTWR
jgi:ketosteroid isomerase-like protein